MTVPGAHIISTRELDAAIQRGLLDGFSFRDDRRAQGRASKTVRDASTFPTPAARQFDDGIQKQVTQLLALTKNSLNMPLMIFCEGATSTCWESCNALLRAEKMGFAASTSVARPDRLDGRWSAPGMS